MNNSSIPSVQELRKLVSQGYYKKALELLEKWLKEENYSNKELLELQIIKLNCLTRHSRYKQARKYKEEIKDSIFDKLEDHLKIQFLLLEAEIHHIFKQQKETIKCCEGIEQILSCSEISDKRLLAKMEVDYIYVRVMYHRLFSDQPEELIALIEKGLELSEKNDLKRGKAKMLQQLSNRRFTFYRDKEDFITPLEEALILNKEINSQWGISQNLIDLGWFYIDSNELEKGYKLTEEALEVAKKIDSHIQISKAYLNFAQYHVIKGNLLEAHEYIKKNYEIDMIFSETPSIVTVYNLAESFIILSKFDEALEILQQGWEIAKQIDLPRFYQVLQNNFRDVYLKKGELNKAMKYAKTALDFWLERKESMHIAEARERLAEIFILKGKLNQALEQLEIVLEYHKKSNSLIGMRQILTKIGEIYEMKGENSIALECHKKCENFSKEIGNNFTLCIDQFNIISNLVTLKEFIQAESQFENLKNNVKNSTDEQTDIYFKLAKILISRNKDREQRTEGIKILSSLNEKNQLDFKIRIFVVLTLCEFIIDELKHEENKMLLIQMNSHLEDLFIIAKKEFSYPLLVQVTWLKAQISLLEMDIQKARNLLNTALKLAESKQLNHLAIKVSNSYDSLLEQLDNWDAFTQKLPTIAEIMGITHIETVLQDMIKGKGITVSDSVQEEEIPYFLLILSEKGSIMFLEQFHTEVHQEVIHQISEKASQSIKFLETDFVERMLYREFTYLIKQLEDLVLIYVFVGKSYTGMKKLQNFAEWISSNKQIRNSLIDAIKANSSLETTSRILINQQIDVIF